MQLRDGGRRARFPTREEGKRVTASGAKKRTVVYLSAKPMDFQTTTHQKSTVSSQPLPQKRSRAEVEAEKMLQDVTDILKDQGVIKGALTQVRAPSPFAFLRVLLSGSRVT